MTAPLQSSERRWAVRVRIWYRGRDDTGPFLAGRFYFDRHGGPHHTAEESPPTATFATREQARARARTVRKNRPGWRVTATAVPVMVTTVELDLQPREAP